MSVAFPSDPTDVVRRDEAFVRSGDLIRRSTESIARAGELQTETRARLLALARLRIESDQHRRELRRLQARRLQVDVEGIIDGRQVGVTWIDGDLAGDADLIARAELLVALGERWEREGLDSEPQTIHATLGGPPHRVALTLARACTRVTSIAIPL